MQEQSFEHLAEEAATGLKADRELFLDVKQELQSHLEDKARHFIREGKSEEESAELACQSFGSPLDVAAELLEANRRRMKLRSLLRLAFGAMVVPLSILLALYVGYGRAVRAREMVSMLNGVVSTGANPATSGINLPALPFFSMKKDLSGNALSMLRQLRADADNAENIRLYWEAHRYEPDSRIYYAYYALLLEAKDERKYVAAMRLGEKIEPQNALYNQLLAGYYLERGIEAKSEKIKKDGVPCVDEMLDRRAFELGIAELRKAVQKPYLRGYDTEVMRRKLQALPQPRFTEDYMPRIVVIADQLFPYYEGQRSLARKIPGGARILAAEGRTAEAMVVMDTWKPLLRLWADDSSNTMKCLVVQACSSILAQDGAQVYDILGARAKARETRNIARRIKRVKDEWRVHEDKKRQCLETAMRQHGSWAISSLYPVVGGAVPEETELMPGRMHEHVLMEEAVSHGVLIVLTLALLGTLIQGYVWLYRLRRSASIHLLLMPSTKDAIRSLVTGIVFPSLIYWLYSRLPLIGGREYGITSSMWPRFAAELLLVGLLIIWLPSHLTRQVIRRRCEELAIDVPGKKDECSTGRKVRGGITAACIVAAAALFIPGDISLAIRLSGVILAGIVCIASMRYAGGKRRRYGLYYGTLARSLAPGYAFSIILLALTVQPWLLYNEVHWLHKDTLFYGYMADSSKKSAGSSLLEVRASQRFSHLLLQALERDIEIQK